MDDALIPLLVALLLLAMNRWGIYRPLPYAVLGIVLWVLLHESGLHATLAGVIFFIKFPGGSGVEPARGAPLFAAAIVVSALADKATAVEAIEKGANGFLCKPFTDDQLNEALAELIGE
jgi:Na+/H+ antiporter NhaA